jgi:glycosyltransferase involved in cell wall biosynthesis
MSSGKILLICAVKNEAGYISKLVSSLQNQTHSNWILHIRNNASTDGTDSIVRQLQRDDKRIQMTCSPTPVSVTVNWGNAVNEALLTPSDFVSCIAGDDYYEKSTHLESLVSALHGLALCALPQFRLTSDILEIDLLTKASPKSMRRNHFRLATKEVYVCSYYGLFKRGEFERILKSRSGRWPTAWEPQFDYWFALEALRNAQSVHNETYIKFVKGIAHTSSYYNPEAELTDPSLRNVNTKIFSMLSRKLWETFVEPPKLFLSGYRRVSLKDFLWIPLFLFAMSASRFVNLLSLALRFLLKPDGFRIRFRNFFNSGSGR